jgi:YVTN family beta-propeller protein
MLLAPACASLPPAREFKVIGEIELPGAPVEVGITQGRAYVATWDKPYLVIIHLGSGKVETSIPLPVVAPFVASFIVGDRDGRYVFIGGSDLKGTRGWILKYDIQSRSVMEQLNIEDAFLSLGAALSADGRRLYVGNTNSRFITVVDIGRMKIERKILMREGGSFGIAISPDGSRLLATHAFEGSVSVIDMERDEVIRVIRNVGWLPVSVAFATNNVKAYVVNNGEPIVTAVDVNSGEITKISIPVFAFREMGTRSSFNPSAAVLPREAGELLVWNPYLRDVAVVDADSEVATSVIRSAGENRAIRSDPSGRWLLLLKKTANKAILITKEPHP